MENSNVVIRTYSSPVSVSNRPAVPSPPKSKSSGNEPQSIVAPNASATSQGQVSQEGLPGITTSEVKEAVSKLNAKLESSARSIRFQVDDTTNDLKVFVVDKETGEVVRSIPPEASIRLSANGELSGLFNIPA